MTATSTPRGANWKSQLEANPRVEVDPVSHVHTPRVPQPCLSAATPYTEWLYFAVPGMTVRQNLYGMDFAIARMPAGGAVVEVGSFCGLSTCAIAHYMVKHNRAHSHRLFGCDKWIFEGAPQDKPIGFEHTRILHSEYRQFVKHSFMRNVGFFASQNLPHSIECFSDEFFDLWRAKSVQTDVFGRPIQLGGPISFAYIDGHHGYDFAKRDWLNTDEFLLPGGFILFDDSADGSGWEVNKVMKELAACGRYDVIVQNPHYLVRKKP